MTTFYEVVDGEIVKIQKPILELTPKMIASLKIVLGDYCESRFDKDLTAAEEKSEARHDVMLADYRAIECLYYKLIDFQNKS